MRHRIAVILFVVVLLALPTFAQQNCQNLRIIGQATLPAHELLRPNDTWGGEVIAMIEGDPSPIHGKFSGSDGDVIWRLVIGMGKDGSLVFDFDEAGTFTTHVTQAVFPITPGRVGFGHYQGNHKIVEGTARFQNATANLLIEGDYFAWPLGDPSDPNTPWDGRFNPSISGKICNLAPPQ